MFNKKKVFTSNASITKSTWTEVEGYSLDISCIGMRPLPPPDKATIFELFGLKMAMV